MSHPAAPANLNIRVFTQSGSDSDLAAPKWDFRYALENRFRADIAPLSFIARKRHRGPGNLRTFSCIQPTRHAEVRK
jgi:hypothetical protein